MKKVWVSLVLVMMLVVGCGSSNTGTEVLKVYNWGEYIDKDVIAQFESEYGVRVQYDTFLSNEDMYTKVMSGEKYDILVPSDYMTQRLREENQLLKLDYSKIPNYAGISDAFKGKLMDPNNEYTVPYFVGSVGIVYDKTKVSASDVETQGWDVLRNVKYKGRLFFYDSERDAFMVALKALGYSMNTDKQDELTAAYDWLVAMRSETSPVYVTDQVLDGMISGEKDLAVMYSGDATYVLSENENLEYYEPAQGTNVWTDAMVIPVNAENPDLAHKFMDFIARPAISQAISTEVGYTSPIPSVVEALTADDGEFSGMSSYTPREGYAKDEEFNYNPKTREIMNDLWLKVVAQ